MQNAIRESWQLTNSKFDRSVITIHHLCGWKSIKRKEIWAIIELSNSFGSSRCASYSNRLSSDDEHVLSKTKLMLGIINPRIYFRVWSAALPRASTPINCANWCDFYASQYKLLDECLRARCAFVSLIVRCMQRRCKFKRKQTNKKIRKKNQNVSANAFIHQFQHILES